MEELVFNPATDTYEPNGVTHFSWLVLAGIIMLSVYLIPIIFRPLDFAQNIFKYIVGFVSYFLMMPMFLNVFTIYAMCNLHDVSWGNRPTSTGTEAFSQNKLDQEKAKSDYLLFRANFVLFWICC